MPNLRTVLLSGAAAAVLGFSGTALAQGSNTRVLTVPLPGEGVAEIRYTGNVPPQVSVSFDPVAADDFLRVSSLFGANSPFAMLGRLSAEVDREATTLFRYADAMAAQSWQNPIGLTLTNLHNLPPGTQSFAYLSTVSGNGVCTRSTEITATRNGPPRVVTHSSGNCRPEANFPGSAGWSSPGVIRAPVAPARAKQPDVLWTKDETAPSYAAMLRDAGWSH